VAKTTIKKIGLEMDARLYGELSKLAKKNGQSRRFLLEKALEQLPPVRGAVARDGAAGGNELFPSLD